MKQYIITLALLIAALVAFSTTHANAQSQPEMNRQAAKDFEKADVELNRTYAALMAKLPEAESKRKLKESQRAWITSRDAEAARAADEARGGSMAPMLRYETMAELTQQRIKQLKTRLTDGAAPNEKEANTPTPRPTATSSTSTQGPDEKPAAAAPSPSLVSPDKKWEFRVDGKGNPQIVRTGTTEAAVELYDKCGPGLGDCKPPLWAPDSKRFAMNAPEQGRYNPTSFYQLKGDKWEELGDGLNDALDQVLEKAIAAQMKKKGLRKKTELRLVSNPFKTINWLDSDTALVYGSKGEVVLGNADVGFAASYLFTIKFDEAGNWKIVKTQHLSEKESKKFEDDSHD